MLRESVSRETPDTRGEQGARTVNLLKSRCRVSPRRAGAGVKNAELTCPDTGTARELGAALAEGAVSREHVDVARSALNRLPCRLVHDRRDEVDHLLTEHARTFDPGTTETLSRHLTLATDQTGMVLINGQLDPVTGLKLPRGAGPRDGERPLRRRCGRGRGWTCGRVVSDDRPDDPPDDPPDDRFGSGASDVRGRAGGASASGPRRAARAGRDHA